MIATAPIMSQIESQVPGCGPDSKMTIAVHGFTGSCLDDWMLELMKSIFFDSIVEKVFRHH